VVSWKLALLVLVGAPATLLPILLLGRRVRRLSRESQDRVADVSAYVDEALHEIRTVQAYAHEGKDRDAFAAHAEAAYRSGVARIGQKAFLIASVMLIAFCAVGVILWVGGHDVFAGRLTAGELSAFVFYAFVVAGGAGTVHRAWDMVLDRPVALKMLRSGATDDAVHRARLRAEAQLAGSLQHPGIAQIYAPRDIPRRQKFKLDQLYVGKQSFWLDLRLIALSFWITVRARWEHRGRKL